MSKKEFTILANTFIISMHNFQNSGKLLAGKILLKFRFQSCCLILIKESIYDMEVKRRRGKLTHNHSPTSYFVFLPLTESAHIIIQGFVFGMKSMRAILMHNYAIFILEIIHIAANMLPPVPCSHFLTLFCQFSGITFPISPQLITSISILKRSIFYNKFLEGRKFLILISQDKILQATNLVQRPFHTNIRIVPFNATIKFFIELFRTLI